MVPGWFRPSLSGPTRKGRTALTIVVYASIAIMVAVTLYRLLVAP